MRFAVDWDGTLVSDDKYPEPGDWLPGAQAFLRYLCDLGEVVIYTCRTSYYEVNDTKCRSFADTQKDHAAIREQLDEAGFQMVGIATNHGKPGADYYIDNKAIEFRGNFDEVLDRIQGYPKGFRWSEEDGRPVYKMVPNTVYEYESVRQFSTGATRNVDDTKIDPEAALSPLVLRRYCEFKASHRKQADGSVRPDDGWQKGIPLESYMKSLQRHNLDAWLLHRGWEGVYSQDMEETLCAIIFNASGYLHELLVAKTREEAA